MCERAREHLCKRVSALCVSVHACEREHAHTRSGGSGDPDPALRVTSPDAHTGGRCGRPEANSLRSLIKTEEAIASSNFLQTQLHKNHQVTFDWQCAPWAGSWAEWTEQTDAGPRAPGKHEPCACACVCVCACAVFMCVCMCCVCYVHVCCVCVCCVCVCCVCVRVPCVYAHVCVCQPTERLEREVSEADGVSSSVTPCDQEHSLTSK